MAVIAMLSAKSAPGVTTSVALLASQWPGPVVVADADPAGGDLAFGWLGSLAAAGRIQVDRGVLSFVHESRIRDGTTPSRIEPHLQRVPGGRDVDVLVGLARRPAGARLVETADWARLAGELADLGRPQPDGVDVLVDCGRYGPETPWPLLDRADLVLITMRAHRRYLFAAGALAATLRSRIEPQRLALAICGSTPARARESARVLGLPAEVELPHDLRTARVFSDGASAPYVRRRPKLVRAAAAAADRLHQVLNHRRHASESETETGATSTRGVTVSGQRWS